MDICPDCGVVDDGNGTCRELFESFLSLEFSDPAYGEVHALTVGTYMIQHYRYSDAALDWVCRNLRAHLNGIRSTQEMRANVRNLQKAENGRPGILRTPSYPLLSRIPWEITIADVALKYEGASSYQDLVRQWADTTLRQLGF